MSIPQRVIDRYLASLSPDGECLVSSYSVGSHGYSQIGWQDDGVRHLALGHKVAWFHEHGEVPPCGMTIDHICRNRRCGNIRHLRMLTNQANASDNGNARKTHCKRGHEFDDINTYRDGRGHRRCRRCMKETEMRRTRRF